MRDLIVRICGVSILIIMLAIMWFAFTYNKHEYTYVIGDKFGKSDNCYIDDNDFRVCIVNKELKRVDMFYEIER